MLWQNYIGHATQREWFETAIAKGHLASTFLFTGPASIGKSTFALLLAKTLMCDELRGQFGEPCNQCESCVQVDAGTHPDLIRLSKPADKSYIPVEMLVGPRESRMQEGLCHDIRLRPFYGRRKIAILDDADHLNQEGANCLLKTLEEPPPGSLLILIGTSLQRQLPTIRSRCQIIRFSELAPSQAKQLFAAREIQADESAIAEALQSCGGDLSQAAAMLSEDARQFRQSLVGSLTGSPPSAIDLASLVTGYVNAAGQDASKRRGRMREVFRSTIEHFRRDLHDRCQGDSSGLDSCLYRIDRCVDALSQIDRNANQQTLVETWAWDIQRGRI